MSLGGIYPGRASSEILQKAVHKQLLSFLSEQLGFKPKSSTITASAYFTDWILHAVDTSSVTGVAFLYLTNAFNTVNHKILVNKLYSLGVKDGARDWVSSVLANRSQFTCCSNPMPNQESVSVGVVQGSILGMLLFVIYMNDLDLPDLLEQCCNDLWESTKQQATQHNS